MIGNLVGGRLADRVGGRSTSVVSLLALAVLEVVVGLVVHTAPAVLFVVLALTALAAYPYFPAQQIRIIARYPADSGSLIAWNNSAMYAGILVGSAVSGTVLTHLGPVWLTGGTGIVALTGALAATRSITSP